MNLRIGGNAFQNVSIPLLWGDRAIVQSGDRKLSIIDLSESTATLEVLFNKPNIETAHRPFEGGFEILHGTPHYSYLPSEGRLKSSDGSLPEIIILDDGLKIGGSTFRNNTVTGFGVGIQVSQSGLAMGAPLPGGLAELSV
jgi:hypothetical protein